jgi:hypothetical protein
MTGFTTRWATGGSGYSARRTLRKVVQSSTDILTHSPTSYKGLGGEGSGLLWFFLVAVARTRRISRTIFKVDSAFFPSSVFQKETQQDD